MKTNVTASANIHNLSIGQIIFIKKGYDHGKGLNGVYSATVEKIGNKYFTIKESGRKKFSLTTLVESCDTNYPDKGYLSMQEILDEKEIAQLSSAIRKVIGPYGDIKATIAQLRDIAKILNIKTNQPDQQ